MNQDEKLLSSLFNLVRLMKEEIYLNKSLEGFTRSEFEVLNLLMRQKSKTMKAIADYLHIKPSSVTPIIDSLAKKGYITRLQNKDDRRIVAIGITKKGESELKKRFKKIDRTITHIFKILKNDEKEKLITILSKVQKNNEKKS